MRADDLTAVAPPAAGYGLRQYGDSDGAWKLVTTPVFCGQRRGDDGLVSEWVTIRFAEGTQQLCKPDDDVEIGPALFA
jgi:hypothetical protein